VTPEGKIKAKVKALFKRIGLYYHMPVQNGMGEPTLDFIACLRGYFIAVETKAPGKKPTARQQITMASMRASGAFVFVVSCEAELATLEAFLNLLS
jgi:predicted hotdog family 3-hydroxylacyl-ACP dehydratase